MKKKLFLLATMVMALCAIFAISASAQEAYVEEVPSNLVDEGESLEYFIVLDGEEYFGASGSTLNSINETKVAEALEMLAANSEYTDAVSALGTKYMIKFVFPATVNGTQITYVYLNNGTNGSEFKKKSYFKDCCAAIVYAPTHTTTGDANECNSKIRSIDFGENSQLTKIPDFYMNGATNLREIKNFPQNLESIGKYAFVKCKLTGVLYINATAVGQKAFDSSLNNVTGIVIGEKTNSIATEAFSAESGTNCATFIEFQGDITKMTITASTNNNGAFYFASGSQRSPYSGLTCLILSHPDNQALITEGTTTFQDFLPNVYFNADSAGNGNLVKKGHDKVVTSEATCYSNEISAIDCACGTQSAEAEILGTMLTTHSYVDDFDCTTCNYCENYGEGKCDKYLDAEATEHIETHDVIFADGFTCAGIHNTYCSNNTCKVLDNEETLGAMFTPEGYSHKENGSAGISAQFRIDTYALKLYEKYEGALHFGIMIANANHFEGVDAFIENGNLTSTNTAGNKSGIQVEMTTREYEYFNCLISGFDVSNEQHTALGLVMVGYVYGDDGEVTYIQKQYTTDDDATTTETPYVSTLTKDATLGVVAITAVQTFEPIASNEE